MAYINFIKCTQQKYSELIEKDSNTLYFLTDSHELYLGSDKLYQVSTEDLATKLNILTAGNNIDINNNTITAKGYTWDSTSNALSVSGKVNASDGFFQTSDERKKNILGEIDLQKAYDMILGCPAIFYTLKGDNKLEIGLIALHVLKYFPEIVNTDSEGYLSVDYSKITVILLAVVKDILCQLKSME